MRRAWQLRGDTLKITPVIPFWRKGTLAEGKSQNDWEKGGNNTFLARDTNRVRE